jgi:hypothetical protein
VRICGPPSVGRPLAPKLCFSSRLYGPTSVKLYLAEQRREPFREIDPPKMARSTCPNTKPVRHLARWVVRCYRTTCICLQCFNSYLYTPIWYSIFIVWVFLPNIDERVFGYTP